MQIQQIIQTSWWKARHYQQCQISHTQQKYIIITSTYINKDSQEQSATAKKLTASQYQYNQNEAAKKQQTSPAL